MTEGGGGNPREDFLQGMMAAMDALASRWADEAGHEDFSGYEAVMHKTAEEFGGALLEMTSAPFAARVAFGDWRFRILVTRAAVQVTPEEGKDA